MQGLIDSITTQAGVISIVLVTIIIAILMYSGKEPKLLSSNTIAIVIGSLLYAGFSFISIPLGLNISFRIAVALLTIFGALYGPTTGLIVGFIGHAIYDAFVFGAVWWNWVYLSATIGLFSGFIRLDKSFDPLEGQFEKRHFINLYMFSAASIFVASAVTFIGGAFFYGEATERVWTQIVLASLSNFGVIAIVGIPSVITLAIMKK